ncbi:septum formation protein Maf [Erythrobacter insulae]|uniref:Nucleoside triphosphate pyrophosphatase n=1 Tax=Erythrobacter insulae TaxID=2584124 RepID=A0A547PB44_9SPHN|nr:Maf family protein [Erythrobacter insulae]TRD11355.1 septum formation protein Maf [Erythrobacter insulae]
MTDNSFSPIRLILASKSASRRAMLDAAGVSYDPIPADVDERAIEDALAGSSPAEIAEALSVAKAAALAPDNPHAMVLGSDSLVVVEGERFDKPTSRENAAQHLRFFSGKTIELHSAAALVRNDTCEWSHTDLARLKVRDLSDDFIGHYLDKEWPAVSFTVGVFRIEAMGVQLFEAITGDQFTVLGMPLLPVLGALREHGVLKS